MWLQSLHPGHSLASPRPEEAVNPLFQPCPCDLIARHPACVTVCGSPPTPRWQPEEPEGQSGWAPGSLSDDSWVGSGNLALKELSAEICLFKWAWALARGAKLGAGQMLPGRVYNLSGTPSYYPGPGLQRAKVEPWDLEQEKCRVMMTRLTREKLKINCLYG